MFLYFIFLFIGRVLRDNEMSHHIDGNKKNNTLSNLFLCKNDNEHRKLHKIDRQFLVMFNEARYSYWKDFKKFDVTKDRQDQLQKKIYKDVKEKPSIQGMIDDMLYWYDFPHANLSNWARDEEQRKKVNNHREYINKFDTWEKFLLVFLMHEKYKKEWRDGKWIERKEA